LTIPDQNQTISFKHHVSTTSTPHETLEPSEWVTRWSHLIQAQSKVLDLACGHGRHALWFAQKGCQVVAVDRNALALSHIKEARHTNIETRCLDLETGQWPLSGESFEALIVTNYLWRSLWSDLIECVRPRGWVIFETFSAGNEQFGSPKRPDFLLNPGELLTVFKDFRIIAYEEGQLEAPQRVVQRIVAQKYEISGPKLSASPLKS
jgi:SAM-dependent methyltransferase